MKRITLLLTAVLFCAVTFQSFATSNTLQGSSLTAFGNYTLVPSQNMVVINNVAYKTWDLKYSGTNEHYQVFFAPGENGQCCITVRNDHFEIQYAKEGNSFGVRLADVEKRTMKKKDVMKQIEYEKFVSQLVLTTSNKSTEEYLGLVACFMPLLFG